MEVLDTPVDRGVVRVRLGCLSSGPDNANDGDWILMLEDAEGNPREIRFLNSVFLMPSPFQAAKAELEQAGYRDVPDIVVKRWAAAWKVVQ